MNGVPEGSRNNAAASVAGRLLRKFSEQKAWLKMERWNKKNLPPLPAKELKAVFESIKKYPHTQNNQSTNPPDQIFEMIKDNSGITLFKNNKGEAYISYPVEDWKEYWPINAGLVKKWIGMQYYDTYHKVARNDAINNAITTLEGTAIYTGDEFKFENRVNQDCNDIYYCLSNKRWEAIKITRDGWTKVSSTPVLFNRYQHQSPQVYPSMDGDIKKIFEFINISNEEHKVLFIVLLVCCFIPDIDHPILYIYGSQGSAKSTTSRFLKEIIDPSEIPITEMPKDTTSLIQNFFHHWFITFDNVSSLSSEFSDLLCRTVTGTGFAKRKLYSDDDDVFYSFRRCIVINGINLQAYKADLLDRSILVELERVPKDKRKYAEQLNNDFRTALPGILGGVFDTLSAAMKIHPNVIVKEVPRMADFARWGYAVAEVLGYGGEEFLRIYKENAELQHDEVLDNSIVGSFLRDFIETRPSKTWEGTATELLKELQDDDIYGKREKELPKNPQTLVRQLNDVKTTLEEKDIKYITGQGSGKKITIWMVGENIDTIETPSSEPETQAISYDDKTF